MKIILIESLAAFLAINHLAMSQTIVKTRKSKFTFIELNQKILNTAENLGIELSREDLSKEDLESIIDQLKLEGIDIKRVDIRDSLLGTQGAVD